MKLNPSLKIKGLVFNILSNKEEIYWTLTTKKCTTHISPKAYLEKKYCKTYEETKIHWYSYIFWEISIGTFKIALTSYLFV